MAKEAFITRQVFGHRLADMVAAPGSGIEFLGLGCVTKEGKHAKRNDNYASKNQKNSNEHDRIASPTAPYFFPPWQGGGLGGVAPSNP